MNTVLTIYDGPGFFGQEYFRNPELFNQYGIEPAVASVTEFTPTELEGVTDEHPESEVDAVLLHKTKQLRKFIKSGVYTDTPLFLAAHVLISTGYDLKKFRDCTEYDRDIFVFAGSVRTARAFHIPSQDNIRVVLAPIMGRSFDEYSHVSDNFIDGPKEYDIGFYSALKSMKQPHRVLETANNVAKMLGEELKVWIAGYEEDRTYNDLVIELIESSHYEHIDAEYKGEIQSRELFDTVQKTRLVYLPLAKPTETTCYAAWEAVSYDVPVVGSDWAGIGEAIRNSRHPDSDVVPVTEVEPPEDSFPESVKKEYPELVEEIVSKPYFSQLMVDESKAQQAVLQALKSDTTHTRRLEIPDQVHAESTMSAFEDILNGVLTAKGGVPRDYIESVNRDVHNTTSGYSLLGDPSQYNPEMYQTSWCHNL